MKKILATILTLVILLSVAPSVGTVAGAAASEKPFYALTWSALNGQKFDNIDMAYLLTVKPMGDKLTLNGYTDSVKLAQTVKAELDSRPEGMRYIRIFETDTALKWDADLVIYADGGVKELKRIFSSFVEAYHDLGGKLDGVILDTEYYEVSTWKLYLSPYGGHYADRAEPGSNRNFYHDVVAHPKYQKELRPLLEEAGFVFYEEIGGDRSEVWSMYPLQTIKSIMRNKPEELAEYLNKYGNCSSIWDQVMDNRIAMYFNYAVYEPLKALYPNVNTNDYAMYDGATWYKNLVDSTNSIKLGSVSNINDYADQPASTYFVDKEGNYLYQNPVSYNEAVYDDDPYGMLLWYVNKVKNIYEATDTKKVSVWISRYDYGTREGSYKSNTAYYTESLYHYGMLDPQPFQVFMPATQYDEYGGQAGYDERLGYISETLNELTRVAGYSDRKPISVPVNWNDGYLLSGTYANGRNIWRITPDTTDGTTLASFKIKDSDPTFKINGTTITFPGGKIIKDTAVSMGSCGYWVETAKNVTPVVTRDTDRYSKNPSYVEDFESYKTGTVLKEGNLKLPQAWKVTADKGVVITAQGSGKALALTGTAVLENVKLPANITAADSYARQQAWEVSVTLPTAMNNGGKVILLNTSVDGGIKLEGGKVYYDDYGSYKELPGVTLTAGKKYTFKRDMDFDAGTCTYSVYEGNKLLKQVADVDMVDIGLPVKKISFSCDGLTTQALIDDYKLYPTGMAVDLAVYDYNGGEQLSIYDKHAKSHVGYRLSWLNATAKKQTVKLKAAFYDSSNALISETVIATVNMVPGGDAVIAGYIANKGAKIRIYVDGAEDLVTESPSGNFGNGDEPETTKSTKATRVTKATKATTALTKPTRASQATRATKTTQATRPGETVAPEETVAAGATAETLAPGETLAPEGTQNTEPTSSVTEEPKDDAKGNKVIVIVAIVVAALAVAGAIWFFLIRKVPVPPVEGSQPAETPVEETEEPEEETEE